MIIKDVLGVHLLRNPAWGVHRVKCCRRLGKYCRRLEKYCRRLKKYCCRLKKYERLLEKYCRRLKKYERFFEKYCRRLGIRTMQGWCRVLHKVYYQQHDANQALT